MEVRECVLCGDGCAGRYAIERPVLLIGDEGTPVQELPSYWCGAGGGRGADVVMLDGWAIVADHTTEAWLVKLVRGAAEQPHSWRMWRDESKETYVVLVQPREHLRAVRLWLTDEWQHARHRQAAA